MPHSLDSGERTDAFSHPFIVLVTSRHSTDGGVSPTSIPKARHTTQVDMLTFCKVDKVTFGDVSSQHGRVSPTSITKARHTTEAHNMTFRKLAFLQNQFRCPPMLGARRT